MRYYFVDYSRAPRYSGTFSASRKWGLPGIHCPLCDAVWSTGSNAYPSVDLSHLPDQAKYSARLEEDYAEFERLREQVRPLAPPDVPLWPGTEFGPLEGSARGEFGPLYVYFFYALLMKGESLRRMQAEGVQGLKGFRTKVAFRKKDPPELLELELLLRGHFHPDCLPADREPPCQKCGRRGWKRPDEMILSAASLPADLDVFRLEDFLTTIIASERFVETTRRLGYEQDIVFRELPVR